MRVSSWLDYWLISTSLLYDLESTDISPALKTDHSLIRISFFLKEAQAQGRGLWKLNTSLLSDEVNKIKYFLIVVKENTNKYETA